MLHRNFKLPLSMSGSLLKDLKASKLQFRWASEAHIRIPYHKSKHIRASAADQTPKETKIDPLGEPDNDLLFDARVRPQVLRPYLEPLPIFQKDDPYEFHKIVTIERLFKARVHFGHKMGTLNDNMKWAIYGERLGVCLFDLDITRKYLVRAMNFLAALSYCGGRFIFLTTNKPAMMLVEEIAAELGQFANTRRWQTGTLLNTSRVLKGPVRTPDCFIFLNTLTSAMERNPAIEEISKACIPSVAVVDSNCEPNYICYPIPGNDDTLVAIEFYMEMFANAIKLGRQARERAQAVAKTGSPLGQQQQQGPTRQPQQRWD